MIINRFVILDSKNKLANEFHFSPNSNVIYSKRGTVGKSSLLKSIYYCLGMNIKSFTKTWNYKQMIFKLYFTHNNQKGWIIRHHQYYKVYDRGELLNEGEYSKWFANLLNMQIKLRAKNSEDLSQVVASAILSLFYIDQDSSWQGTPFRNTASLTWYDSKDMPKSIFEYVLNLKSNEHLEKEEEKRKLKKELSELTSNQNLLLTLKDQFITTENCISFINEDVYKEDLRKYLSIISHINQKRSSYNGQIYSKQVELDSLKLEIRELEEILKYNNESYENHSIRCSKCDSFLTEQQSKERMKLDFSSFLLAENIKDVQSKIKKVEQDLNSLLNIKIGLDEEYNTLSNQRNMTSSKASIDAYIQSVGEKKSQDKYYAILNDLKIKISKINDDLKKINKDIKNLTKEQDKKRVKIDSDFTVFFNELADELPSVDGDFTFLKFNQIQNSGSALNQTYLVIYLTYIKILMKYSSIELPFVMDSIIKDELDAGVISSSYLLVNKVLLSSQKQTFFAALNDKFQYLTGECNRIEIKSDHKLLNKESYENLKNEIVV